MRPRPRSPASAWAGRRCESRLRASSGARRPLRRRASERLPPPPRTRAHRRGCSRHRRRGARGRRGAPPRSSTISNAAVFWPSTRNGLSELTRTCVPRSASTRADASASSKLPRIWTTWAPSAPACATLARGDGAEGLEDESSQSGARRVGRGGRRRVPGRRADHGRDAGFERLRDGERSSPGP